MMPLLARARLRQFAVALILTGCSSAAAAVAQLTGDQVPRDRTNPAEEQIKLEIERSRFRLGPIRILPRLEISQAGYDSNVFGVAEEDPVEPVGDWSATVAAGIGLVLPMGSKLYLRGHALPAYTWYREIEGRRNWGGSYDAALLAFFNRMFGEAGGYTSESVNFLNTETETRVVEQVEGGRAKVEVELTRALSLFVGGELRRLDFRLAGGVPIVSVDPEEFDRTETLAQGGLRFRLSPSSDISVAFEGTQTEFVRDPERDNRTRAYLLGIHYSRPRLFINLVGAYRDARPYNGSRFPEYSTPSGSLFLSFFPRENLELRLYGNRQSVYSGFAENTHFIETRGGLALNIQVLRSLLLHGFGEYGVSDYDFSVPVGDTLVERRDPSRTLGGGFSLIVFRDLVVTATAYENQHRSNIPGLERTVFRFVTAVSMKGEFTR